MSSCFIGKYLFVDLTDGSFTEKELPKEWAEKYTGQKGLGTRMLMEYAGADVDPEFGSLADRANEVEKVANVETTTELLGWAPSVELLDGLSATLEWYQGES